MPFSQRSGRGRTLAPSCSAVWTVLSVEPVSTMTTSSPRSGRRKGWRDSRHSTSDLAQFLVIRQTEMPVDMRVGSLLNIEGLVVGRDEGGGLLLDAGVGPDPAEEAVVLGVAEEVIEAATLGDLLLDEAVEGVGREFNEGHEAAVFGHAGLLDEVLGLRPHHVLEDLGLRGTYVVISLDNLLQDIREGFVLNYDFHGYPRR